MFAYLTLLDSITMIIFREDKLWNVSQCDIRVQRCSIMRVDRRRKIHKLRLEEALVQNNSTTA